MWDIRRRSVVLLLLDRRLVSLPLEGQVASVEVVRRASSHWDWVASEVAREDTYFQIRHERRVLIFDRVTVSLEIRGFLGEIASIVKFPRGVGVKIIAGACVPVQIRWIATTC